MWSFFLKEWEGVKLGEGAYLKPNYVWLYGLGFRV